MQGIIRSPSSKMLSANMDWCTINDLLHARTGNFPLGRAQKELERSDLNERNIWLLGKTQLQLLRNVKRVLAQHWERQLLIVVYMVVLSFNSFVHKPVLTNWFPSFGVWSRLFSDDVGPAVMGGQRLWVDARIFWWMVFLWYSLTLSPNSFTLILEGLLCNKRGLRAFPEQS